MASLTRSSSKTAQPGYKDYVNFLGNYKSGKKEDFEDYKKTVQMTYSNNTVFQNSINNEHNNISRSLSNSTTTSNSSVSSDVTDFPKNTCLPYNTYLENSKNKKFNSVKPTADEKSIKRSEIFIEIQPTKSVSEVSKVFEKNKPTKNATITKNINSKISIFEKQKSAQNKPKFSEKPVLTNKVSPPKILVTKAVTPPPPMEDRGRSLSPPLVSETTRSLSPPPLVCEATIVPTNPIANGFIPPPPPPPPPMAMPINTIIQINKTPPPTTNGVPKMQATLVKGPTVMSSVNNTKGINPAEIDKNDPMVRKLVYGTLRGLYGAYHDKANDIVATMPRNRVVKTNGVQDIINKIASNGDLEKLSGRANPKSDQEQ